MEDLYETVRSLSTLFTVMQSSDEELVLALESANVAGVVRPANLRFQEPHDVWASCWDATNQEWKDLSRFAIPDQGKIAEAFIKPIGNSVKLSLSDKGNPLIRWGFTAKRCIVE